MLPKKVKMKIDKLDFETLDNVRIVSFLTDTEELIYYIQRQFLMLAILLDNIIDSMGFVPLGTSPMQRVIIILSKLSDQ